MRAVDFPGHPVPEPTGLLICHCVWQDVFSCPLDLPRAHRGIIKGEVIQRYEAASVRSGKRVKLPPPELCRGPHTGLGGVQVIGEVMQPAASQEAFSWGRSQQTLCKGLESRYFQLCRSRHPHRNSSALPLYHKAVTDFQKPVNMATFQSDWNRRSLWPALRSQNMFSAHMAGTVWGFYHLSSSVIKQAFWFAYHSFRVSIMWLNPEEADLSGGTSARLLPFFFVFLFSLFFLCLRACGILVPWTRGEICAPNRGGSVLVTGLPGNSPFHI